MRRLSFIVWLMVAAILYLSIAAWAGDRAETCVSSMMVEVGKPAVVNPVTCTP